VNKRTAKISEYKIAIISVLDGYSRAFIQYEQ